MKWPDPHRQQTIQILKKERTSSAQKQRESRIAFSNACAYITDTAQATTNDKQEWQIGKWKKFGKTMMAKAWVESIRQLTGCKSRLGKLATFPDVRLVYHESGRWKLLAGFQKEESREEMKKKDLHDTETVPSDRGKEMADAPSSGKNLLVPGNKLLQRTQTGHQRQLQRKSEGLPDEDGTPSSQWYIAQLSELRLVYHESVRRKWVAKYQIDAP